MRGLILTHAVALVLLWYAPYFWIRLDAAAFSKDVSNDTFHTVFHRQRLLWRVGFAVVVALLSGVPALLLGVTPYIVSTAALLAIAAGWHAYVFNPGLNVARQLPYVGKYYVSFDANAAAFPDRWIRDRARRKAARFLHGFGTARDLELLAQQYAPPMLRSLLRWCFLASLAAYAAGVATILLWTPAAG